MFSPGVETVVNHETRELRQHPAAYLSRCGKEPRVTEQYPGELHRKPFGPWQVASNRNFLAPGEKLRVQIDFDRADIAAGPAKAASERKAVVGGRVAGWGEDGTDGTGDCGFVTVTAAAPIDGAGIHAGTAANTVERASEIV